MPDRPPKNKKPIRQQLAESGAMLKARDQAAQTPEEVRKAFLTRTRAVGPLVLQPFSLGILWLFEELNHPFNATPTDAPAAPLTIKDTARAIYVFSDPEGAAEALASGLEAFDTAAMALAFGIAPEHLPAISAAIKGIFQEGLATIPGAGATNPPAG